MNSLKFISETHRSLHTERIKHEFKLVITLVTFYLLSASFKIRVNNFPINCMNNCLDWVLFSLLAIFASLYLRGSSEANEINQEFAKKMQRI